MAQFMADEERQEAINVLASQSDVLGEVQGARRSFVEGAGLRRFGGGLNFGTNPRTFAIQLVTATEDYGWLEERPNTHALGALLTYALSLGDLPRESAALLARIVVKYALITDGDRLEKMRQQYNITDAPTPISPEAPKPVSLAKVADQATPTFAAPDIEAGVKEALEKVINDESNFLDTYLLAGAVYTSQAVGRIERADGRAMGTGFLVGPNLLLTNQHVLTSQELLEDAVVRFGYQNGPSNVADQGRVVRFDRDFYQASPPDEFDYALVKLLETPLEEPMARLAELAPDGGLPPFTQLLRHGGHRGYLLLRPLSIQNGDRINIIQHPRGEPQKVVVTQNFVVNSNPTRVHYLADTDSGSSGSPVLNRNWEVVALHHSGNPYPALPEAEREQLKLSGNTVVNEGIPMRAILPKIDRYLPKA